MLLLTAFLAVSARAQTAGQNGNPITPQDLAKSVHNPFEDYIKVQLQSATGFSIGPHHNAGESFNIQPLIPVRLTSEWDLFVRPSLSVTYQPTPHEQYGLNDLQTSFFISPHNADKWIWGVGPILQLPTASSEELGTGRWSAGPTAALIYSNGPWFSGILTSQLMSFAGRRARGSVNQTYVETQISYNFESGWYVDTDPPMTFDWTTDAANGWTIPVGIDVGKAFNLGVYGMGFQIGAYDLVERPDGAPQWVLRVQFTALFPRGW